MLNPPFCRIFSQSVAQAGARYILYFTLDVHQWHAESYLREDKSWIKLIIIANRTSPLANLAAELTSRSWRLNEQMTEESARLENVQTRIYSTLATRRLAILYYPQLRTGLRHTACTITLSLP